VSGSTSAGRGNRARLPDGLGRHCWIPGIASLLCLLVGMSDVLTIFKPWHKKLHRISAFVPGTVVIGLLTSDIAICLAHISRGYPPRVYSAVVAVVLLAVLPYFRREFYVSRLIFRCARSPARLIAGEAAGGRHVSLVVTSSAQT
jgi:hypothetical protein